jgi:RNA polymerase sporulation-specific sigma factor
MEDKLVERAKSGDENAINQLLNTYKPLVTIIAHKYFLINAEQSDLVQEGMIGLFKAYRSYNLSSPTSFKTYASVCIKRQIQTALEKNNRQKNKPINTYLSINNQGKILLSSASDADSPDEDENGFYLEAGSLSPEESVIYRENMNEIANKINNSLSSFEKIVLKLFVSGMNYVQIATKLKKEPKSIDNALSRIKMKLKGLKE